MKQSLQTPPGCESVWTHRDMRLVLPARALSFLGDSIAFIVLSLTIAESDEPGRMTVMFIAFSLPLFLLAPVAGRLVDECDSRHLLVAAGALQVVASLVLVWGPSFAAIIGGVLLLQAGQSITGPTWAAIVPRIVGDAMVGKAVGLQQSLSALAGLGGAAAGGVLYDVLGYHSTMLIDAATFAGLVVVGAVVRTRRGRRFDEAGGRGDRASDVDAPVADPHASDAPAPVSGARYIAGDSLLKLLVPALWLFILSLEGTNVVEVFLVTGDLGASSTLYGVTMAAFMLGQIAGPVLAGRVMDDRRRVAYTALSAGTIGADIVATGLSPSVLVVIPLFAVCGVAGGALNSLINTIVVTRPPEHLRGRVLAAVNGSARGFSVLAMVLGGLSGQILGARGTYVVGGLVSALVALLVLRCRAGAHRPEVLPVPALAGV